MSGQTPRDPCDHFVADPAVDPALDVCSVCVPMGGRWLHLRQCLTCGLTACCDDSPNRHASGHARVAGRARRGLVVVLRG